MPDEFRDLYDAWMYLANHPMIADEEGDGHLKDCLDIDPVRVNPETEEIDDDVSKNTAVRVWLEFGPWIIPGGLNDGERALFSLGFAQHDISFDCGGETVEQAVMKLATLVRDHPKYGQMTPRSS